LTIRDFTIRLIKGAFKVGYQLLVSKMSRAGFLQASAQGITCGLHAPLVDNAPSAGFAHGKVIVGVDQFRRRERPLAISFDELLREMSVHCERLTNG
jgi:hypothetical protein